MLKKDFKDINFGDDVGQWFRTIKTYGDDFVYDNIHLKKDAYLVYQLFQYQTSIDKSFFNKYIPYFIDNLYSNKCKTTDNIFGLMGYNFINYVKENFQNYIYDERIYLTALTKVGKTEHIELIEPYIKDKSLIHKIDLFYFSCKTKRFFDIYIYPQLFGYSYPHLANIILFKHFLQKEQEYNLIMFHINHCDSELVIDILSQIVKFESNKKILRSYEFINALK